MENKILQFLARMLEFLIFLVWIIPFFGCIFYFINNV